MADRVLSMELDRGILFLRKAREKENEDKLFRRWISGYQDKVSFDEFKNSVFEEAKKARKSENQSAEDILEKVRKIINKE